MKITFFRALPLLTALSLCTGVAQLSYGQSTSDFQVVNRSISTNKKLKVIHLDAREDVGIAWIKGKKFSTGTIEFDVKGKDKLQESFVGIAFHGSNDKTYESVYFRPFNFRATDPVRKSHAVQYIANPDFDWPKLREEFPGKYEQPILPDTDPNEWFHVRIKVSTSQISVYVNGNAQSTLEVSPLVPQKGTMIGYWVGNGSAGDWKNLVIKPQ